MGGVVWNDNTMHDAFNDTSGGKDSDNKESKPTMAVGVVKNLEDGFGNGLHSRRRTTERFDGRDKWGNGSMGRRRR